MNGRARSSSARKKEAWWIFGKINTSVTEYNNMNVPNVATVFSKT